MSARWRLVPVEPTWGAQAGTMSRAGADCIPACDETFGGAGLIATRVYSAMLAAAPPASGDAELLCELTRVIDPVAWDDSRWSATRADVEEMHRRRQIANDTARAVLKMLEGA